MQVQDFVYIVGTEEGAIYKCSTAYSTEVLLTYTGHDMAVYAVRWNQVHSATFLSSSADWTVKLWHADSPKVDFCASRYMAVQAKLATNNEEGYWNLLLRFQAGQCGIGYKLIAGDASCSCDCM